MYGVTEEDPLVSVDFIYGNCQVTLQMILDLGIQDTLSELRILECKFLTKIKRYGPYRCWLHSEAETAFFDDHDVKQVLIRQKIHLLIGFPPK